MVVVVKNCDELGLQARLTRPSTVRGVALPRASDLRMARWFFFYVIHAEQKGYAFSLTAATFGRPSPSWRRVHTGTRWLLSLPVEVCGPAALDARACCFQHQALLFFGCTAEHFSSLLVRRRFVFGDWNGVLNRSLN